MLKDITIGQFYPSKSVIHRLDARTKLLATLLLMVAIFTINQFWPYSVLFLFLLFITKLSTIPVSYIMKGLKPLRWIILFTFVINIFFVQGDHILRQL